MLLLISYSLYLLLIHSTKSDSPSYCLPIQPIAPNPAHQPTPETVQGRPGRIGPVGPPGPRGTQGIPGQCACDPSEIEQLNDIINSLQDRLASIESRFLFNCYVGIKDSRIPNSAMTASSHHGFGYQAYYGRLDNAQNDPRACWHAADDHSRAGEWLQVDFGQATRIVGVITQGRRTAGQWTRSYKIGYGNTTSLFSFIQNRGSSFDMVFQGNRDRNSKVTNFFPAPITARYFRLVVEDFHFIPVLRIEYLTCDNRQQTYG